MTTKTAAHLLASYLITLDVSNDLNASFVAGSNLHIGRVLGDAHSEESLTINLYPGESPITNRQTAGLQLIFKSTSPSKARGILQFLINNLDGSSLGGRGSMKAISSAPEMLASMEGGEHVLAVANFRLKHVIIE